MSLQSTAFRRLSWLIGACVVAALIFIVQGTGLATRLQRSSPGGGAVSGAARSRITRLQVDKVQSPVFEGQEFGKVGRYEQLSGRLYGELDPADPRNASIVNIDRAPRNASGMVEYSAEFRILKPMDPARGNATLIYDVVNRGYQRAFNFHVGYKAGYGAYPAKAADLGDGFLLNQGYTLVWSGWQGDLSPGEDRLTGEFPVARNRDGASIHRWIGTEFNFTKPARSVRLQGENMRSYPAVAESMKKASLYRRSSPHGDREMVPRDTWSFAECSDPGKSVPSNVDVCMPGGFSPNYVYDMVYEAQDPIVMGVGFASVRDLAVFLRHDATEANPLMARSAAARNPIRWAIMFGQSQSGRFIRDFVHLGFNQDPSGRMVFEGAIPTTSGARGTFTNFEFSEAGRFSRPVEDHYAPGDQFPFTYATITDPVSGRIDGLLASCSVSQTCPKMMQWDSSTEGWSARASLLVTDPLGSIEIPLPDNVRYYYFAGTQHQPGSGPAPPADPRGICQQLPNATSYREGHRALLTAMQAWVTAGTNPPASLYPRLSDGTLVPPLPQSAQGFPSIPGVRYTGKMNDLYVNDYFTLPTRHTSAGYKVLVPKVDSDGNEVAGVRSTAIQAPLGTHTGWGSRRAGFMEDEVCGLLGSYVPFAKKAADRGSDPRPSLEERYGTQSRYVAEVRAATERLQKGGYLLPQDAQRLITEAEQRDLGLPK